jgi:hypothetical protein
MKVLDTRNIAREFSKILNMRKLIIYTGCLSEKIIHKDNKGCTFILHDDIRNKFRILVEKPVLKTE